MKMQKENGLYILESRYKEYLKYKQEIDYLRITDYKFVFKPILVYS